MNLYSRWIAAARHMKAKGDTYSHKHCLRVARAEVNMLGLTRGQPARYDRLAWQFKAQVSVVVMKKPAMPGSLMAVLNMRRGNARAHYDVVVIGAGPRYGRGLGKSVAMMLALSAIAGTERPVRRPAVVFTEEAQSIGLDGWDRLIGTCKAIALDPGTPCHKMSGIQFAAPMRGKELRRYNSQVTSRGDKIRSRKMFGGWS